MRGVLGEGLTYVKCFINMSYNQHGHSLKYTRGKFYALKLEAFKMLTSSLISLGSL